IDNNESYYPDNCVPCCEDCNIMKKTIIIEHFIKRCKHLAHKFNPEIGDNTWYYPDTFYNPFFYGKNYIKLTIEDNYKDYVKRAKDKNRKFEYDLKTFSNIVNNNVCVYCELKDFKHHNIIGLDRVDSTGHYTFDNCVPACSG